MTPRESRRRWPALLVLSFAFVAVCAAAPQASQAEDTVWICKPGQADDLCAGTIEGQTIPPPGQDARPLGYSRPADAPVDCFYLYPTQSSQPTPNSNLDKDPPIRRVVVQQARMFSSVCDVYAPMYRQVTYSGSQLAHNAEVETAYQSARSAFVDFLENHSRDRGFIMLGHSQGAAHTGRLIAEIVDTDPELRERFVGAIAPGANYSVPIGRSVGGLFDNVPACTGVGEYGCVIAYSMFDDVPGRYAAFSRLDFGYWIYPEPRPDPTRFEAMCTNPAVIDGGTGVLDPLVNMDYIAGAAQSETPAPWVGLPDYYRTECRREGGAHWLHLSEVGLPGDDRPNLGAAVASGSNYHVPEVNLAEGNLIRIAQLQTDSYMAERERLAGLRARLGKLRANLAKAKKRRAAAARRVTRLAAKLKQVEAGKQRKTLRRKLRASRKSVAAERRRIKSIQRKIERTERQLG